MAQLSPAPSIDDVRGRALLELVARLGALDLTPVLVYRVDSVPEGALSFLAWQFDVVSSLWQLILPPGGASGWDAIGNIDQLTDIDTLAEAGTASADPRRSLLQMAVELHRYRGTPWAIKTALATLGWSGAALSEGESSWGGTNYPSTQGWAVFRVAIALGSSDQVESGDSAEIAAVANFFKPARSWLDSVCFATAPMADEVIAPRDVLALGGIYESQMDAAPTPQSDALSLAVAPAALTDVLPPARPLYDGVYRYSGIGYGASQPQVADSALVLDGIAVLEGG